MQQPLKPRLGVLGLMLEAYEPLFPGIMQRQDRYVRDLLESLSEVADFTFPSVAANRETIEKLTAQYNAEGLDGIVILMLSYSQGQFLAHAMQRNHLPLALALVQPDETVDDDFEEIDLTVNQGIHGSQDNANGLMRAGIRCAYFAGSKSREELGRFLADFGAAAKAYTALKSMKIGVIGKLRGMGDVITDDMAVFRKLGPEFIYDSIGTVHRYCAAVAPDEVSRRVAYERTVFDIDPKLPAQSHAEAVRMYLGLRRYLEENGYDGYTAHFEEFGEDGRFTQLPLLAASSLMADGYGYAAEGDATTAMLVRTLHNLCGMANFSEMYMMDLARDALLFCHAGEGNWKACRRDRKPFLADRVLSEGGLGNPPTPIFAPQPGPAVVASLVHVGGERFRLVCAPGEVLDKCDLRRCDMPYMFFRPRTGVRPCIQGWLEAGGTHHEAIVYGDWMPRLRLLCNMLDIETTIV